MTNIINNLVFQLETTSTDQKLNITNRAIATYMLSLLKKKMLLPEIVELSETLYISVASISKFISKYCPENYQVLRYIYKINNKSSNEIDKTFNEKEDIKKASDSIRKAKRVLLVGTGNSGLIAKLFQTKLVLNDIHAFFLEGKPDQITMIDKMGKDDVIVCFSHSFSHQWTKNLLNKKTNIIIFTSNASVKEKENIQVFISKFSKSIVHNSGHDELAYISKVIFEIVRAI